MIEFEFVTGIGEKHITVRGRIPQHFCETSEYACKLQKILCFPGIYSCETPVCLSMRSSSHKTLEMQCTCINLVARNNGCQSNCWPSRDPQFYFHRVHCPATIYEWFYHRISGSTTQRGGKCTHSVGRNCYNTRSLFDMGLGRVEDQMHNAARKTSANTP